MELRPAQFARQLAAEPLRPVYLVAGSEPLLVQEAADAVRARARLGGFDQELQRIMGIIAAGAHPDMARSAEQRGRARFIAQQRGIAPEVCARQFDPLARIGQGSE